jgi:hypothetical protein
VEGFLQGYSAKLRRLGRLDGQRHHGFGNQLLLRILLRENFCFANDQHFASSQHAASATQLVGDCRPQKINLEFDTDDVLVQPHCAPRRAAGSVVRHGGEHARVDQTVLLLVTLSWDQHGFAIVVLNRSQFDSQVANEVGVVKYVADSALSEFINGIESEERASSGKSACCE